MPPPCSSDNRLRVPTAFNEAKRASGLVFDALTLWSRSRSSYGVWLVTAPVYPGVGANLAGCAALASLPFS